MEGVTEDIIFEMKFWSKSLNSIILTVMRKFPDNQLIIFSRYPRPGFSKTRLIPALGPEGAAHIQRALTELTLKRISPLLETGFIEARLWFQGGSVHEMRKWLGAGLIYEEQADGDLGNKMRVALDKAFEEKGVSRAVIIGTDIHDLTDHIISESFQALGNRDLVIGPATDGGYYLIGMNSAHPELFINIAWGTSKVFEQTLGIANSEKLSSYILPTLNDVDRPEDLVFLKKDFLCSTLGGK